MNSAASLRSKSTLKINMQIKMWQQLYGRPAEPGHYSSHKRHLQSAPTRGHVVGCKPELCPTDLVWVKQHYPTQRGHSEVLKSFVFVNRLPRQDMQWTLMFRRNIHHQVDRVVRRRNSVAYRINANKGEVLFGPISRREYDSMTVQQILSCEDLTFASCLYRAIWH